MTFIDLYPETYEYPSRDLILEGPKDGQWFEYVSHTYLNGFINYTEKIAGFVINRYADENFDYNKAVESIKNSYHTNFSDFHDDVIIIAKGAGSYWFFWNDKDCSDCIIARTEIDRSEEEFIELTKNFINSTSYPIVAELSKKDFSGWVTL